VGAFQKHWSISRTFMGALAAILLSNAAQSRPVNSIDIAAGPLSSSLVELAEETGIELPFDETLVEGLRGPPIKGRFRAEAALAILLEGSGLGYRKTPDGVFILFALRSQVDGSAVPEILVVGRRTQNVDIRRSQNDIQGYKISTARDVQTAHRPDVDSFMRSRVPANADIVSPSLGVDLTPGATYSRVDLRGVGSQRSLVLIDGRRIPGMPISLRDIEQGDLNGVPLGAIDRIETLTSTASGIYGPGAIGGVVNIILRRDYRGADATVTSGLSDRGDSARLRLEGRIGFTPDGGNTDIMLYGSLALNKPILASQRDFQARSRALSFGNDPAYYLESGGLSGNFKSSNAIVVEGAYGASLSLDSSFGGGALNSSFTYLPINFSGSATERTQTLLANAGKLDLTPAVDRTGQVKSLVNTARVTSGLLTVRRKIGSSLELFLDAFVSQNHGDSDSGSDPTPIFTRPDAPNNPFQQTVIYRFPSPVGGTSGFRVDMHRIVGGLIVTLPAKWRAELEFAQASVIATADQQAKGLSSSAFGNALAFGTLNPTGQPLLDPLGDWATFQNALTLYLSDASYSSRQINRFTDVSIRLAGPLAQLSGGPLSLSLLAEQRREHVPASNITQSVFGSNLVIVTPDRTQSVRSIYGEVRAPLLSMDSALMPLRGLEVGVAARFDQTNMTFPDNYVMFLPSNDLLITERRNAVTFTVGAKVFPIAGVMLRGSFATGESPPTLSQLQSREAVISGSSNGLRDALRGGERLGLNGSFSQWTGGSHNIQQEHADTLSFGIVINSDRGGPRLSVDYSRITLTRQIVSFPLQPIALLAQEARYPDRVIRAPLTATDAALGYTVGPVSLIDLRDGNSGRSIVEAVDVEFDWQLTDIMGGELRPYARASWQPRARSRRMSTDPWIDRLDRIDGPLSWRGNLGMVWQGGSTSLDLNIQYFHGYRVTSATTGDPISNEVAIIQQGREWLPAQVYVDLAVSRAIEIRGFGPLQRVELRAGVQNLLDTDPPILAGASTLGYSSYADPRRRRGEIVLSAKF